MTATVETAARRGAARVGVIGTGGIGRSHAEAAAGLPQGLLAGVADIDPERAAAVAAEYGAPVLTVVEMADRDLFDLVVVATPPANHVEVVEPLLRAGVPVLCEKPIAVNAQVARQLTDLSASTNTPLTMATKFRFVDDVIQTRDLISAGALGKVLKVEVSFAGQVNMAGRWNTDQSVAGGGVVIDNATHAVDLVRYLLGDIDQVHLAVGPSGQPFDVEDSATMLLRTAEGALGQIDVTWSFRRLSPVYCAVYGTRGTVEIGWKGATVATVDTPTPTSFGSGYRKIDSLRDNLAAVVSAIGSNRPMPVGPDDAVAAAAAIDAAYASAAAGTWVPVGAPS